MTFYVVPLFANSPLSVQAQAFKFVGPNDTDITTPFGIPFWTPNITSGPWALVVVNNLGHSAICQFTVVP